MAQRYQPEMYIVNFFFVVYKNKDQVFEDLGIFDNRYYDRCTGLW